jgi:malonate decarboxylase epsilon subunit
MKHAMLFPGQGSQFPGMLRNMPEHPVVTQVFEHAETILGQRVCDLDSATALRSTRNVQVALFLAGVASFRMAEAENCKIHVVAGLSVGTFAAAVACGAATFEDLLPAVALRGQLMEDAYPSGYGMMAVSGLPFEVVAEIVKEVQDAAGLVYLANRYGYKQAIVAGSLDAMKQVAEQAMRGGATSVKQLDVSCPSHCPLLESVELKLTVAMAAISFTRAACPYLSNRTTRLVQDAEKIREDLSSNAAHPIRWFDGMQLMQEHGVSVYVEAFPGAVLSRLAGDEGKGIRRVPLEAGWKAALSLLCLRPPSKA